MKKSLIFALCAVGLILAPALGSAADLLSAGQPAPGRGLFFDIPTSTRMLDELEQCRVTVEENKVLTALDQNHEKMEEMLRQRIKILEQNQADLLRMNDAALKNAEIARKTSGGKWYQKAYNTGKWLGLGILVGLAIGGF